VQGLQAHPKCSDLVKMWEKSLTKTGKISRSLGKICENLRKIAENLVKLHKNTSKNGAQLALI